MNDPLPMFHAPHDPGQDAVNGINDGSLANMLQLFLTGVPTIPGLNAVWLAPDACLMHSHTQPAEGEPVVVRVVGVADCGDWDGAVLMLG